MRVVILCNYLNSNYARAVLRALNARGMRRIHIVAVVGATTPRTVTGLWQKYRFALPRVVLRSIATRLAWWMARAQDRKAASEPSLEAETIAQRGKFVVVREINGEEGCSALQSLETDLLVLAGTPIIRAAVLAVPRIGTLNAHQGALPKFRGMNVIEWAVFQSSPPTISIHFVDPGVDTGDVIVDEAVPLVLEIPWSACASARGASSGPARRRCGRCRSRRALLTAHAEGGRRTAIFHYAPASAGSSRTAPTGESLAHRRMADDASSTRSMPSLRAEPLWSSIMADAARFRSEGPGFRPLIRGVLSQGFQALLVYRIFRWFHERGIPTQPVRFIFERFVEITTGISIPVERP